MYIYIQLTHTHARTHTHEINNFGDDTPTNPCGEVVVRCLEFTPAPLAKHWFIAGW